MLNNATNFKLPLLTGKIVKGVVEDNNDPLHMGRLKVRVDGLHSIKMLTEDLPWVMSLEYFSNSNQQGNLHIPDLNSPCWLIFPGDDIYSGIYLGCLPNIKEELLEDYPNSYGSIDRSGSLFLANTNTDNYTFQHVSGTTFNIDAKGNVKIQVANNQVNMESGIAENPEGISIEVIGNVELKANQLIDIECVDLKVKASNSIEFNSGNSMNLSSQTFTQNANSYTLNCSNYNLSTSSYTLQSSGNITSVSGGSYTIGGSSVSVNGLPFQIATITVIDTLPIGTAVFHSWMYACFGPAAEGAAPAIVPPPASPTAPEITNIENAQLEPQPARTRQAYKGESTTSLTQGI